MANRTYFNLHVQSPGLTGSLRSTAPITIPLNARKTHPDWSLWLIIFHVGVQVHSTSTYRQAELIHELARVSLSIFTSFARLQYLTSAVAWPAHPMPSPPYTASHP